ncbi:DUF4856 domain-containing protein [Portibacter marinus]|uniref:DUF4856 domain-containing protein n=1 Tax=Portibacter marinus TaxID=2898660 RepID=UPI001F216D94|nr:DUF4856 domain-containing protein [Portibacter marinus]
MKQHIYIFLAVIFILMGCEKDQQPKEVKIDVPTFYTFSRDGQSTVSFEGQTTRIKMAEELVSAMEDFTQSEEQLINMFRNVNTPFSDQDLNSSSKSIKSKVAASKDFFATSTAASSIVKGQFETWLSLQTQEIFPASNRVAEVGIAGQIADGNSTRYVNAKGLEYNQAFTKGLIGALMTDQMLNNYLSVSVLDEGNNRAENDEGIIVENKPYTNMEHKWDEAYGYLFGASASASDPLSTLGADDSFLNKYLFRVNNDPDFSNIAQDIYDAFKKGRAAIVAGAYDVRDEQAEIIRELVSTVIGVRSVYYLQQGKNALSDENYGTAFHDLSEGYGFIYSLQFTREPNTFEPYVDRDEVLQFLERLDEGNGFWDVDSATLDDISRSIADQFNFTLEQAAQ